MINKFFFILFVVFNFFINFSLSCSEIFIKVRVNNEIVTNLDIKNEKNYLMALNPRLKNIENEKLERYAIDSIINEKVKKIEIEKFINPSVNESMVDKVLKDLYSNLGINDLESFTNYLIEFGIDINQVKKKILIEISWNDYIVKKYGYAIVIDENKIKEKIKKIFFKSSN